MEHPSFTEKEVETFTQLCRVVIQDFLPFVKKSFDSLFSASSVEHLALTTPYALRHRKTKKKDGSTVVTSLRPSVELNMELNITVIGEALRGVAPDVFEVLERRTAVTGGDEVSGLTVDLESLLSKAPVEQPLLTSPAESNDPVALGVTTFLPSTLVSEDNSLVSADYSLVSPDSLKSRKTDAVMDPSVDSGSGLVTGTANGGDPASPSRLPFVQSAAHTRPTSEHPSDTVSTTAMETLSNQLSIDQGTN